MTNTEFVHHMVNYGYELSFTDQRIIKDGVRIGHWMTIAHSATPEDKTIHKVDVYPSEAANELKALLVILNVPYKDHWG